MTGSTRSIAQLARVCVIDVDQEELPILAVATEDFYRRGWGRRRIVQAVIQRTRRQIPAGFGSEANAGVAATVLVVLNAIVAGTLGQGDEGRRGWLAGRRLTRRLRRVLPGTGPDTILPILAGDRADRVAIAAREVARRSGLSEEQAERLSRLVRDAITVPAGSVDGADLTG